MTDISYQAPSQEAEASLGDYFALMKPRVMQLVVFTAVVGLLAAPVNVHPVIAFASILFVAVGAGASGALNMWWDADIDAVMRRTAKRPIPSAGKVTADEAKVLGFACAVWPFDHDAGAERKFAGGRVAGVHDLFLHLRFTLCGSSV